MAYKDPSKHVFSEEEAASLLGMTKSMLARRRYAGKIGHMKDGHFIGYIQRHLDEYCGKFDIADPPEPEPVSPPPSKKTSDKSAWHKLPWSERKKTFRIVTAEQMEKDRRSAQRRAKSGRTSSILTLLQGSPTNEPTTTRSVDVDAPARIKRAKDADDK